jgi:hypothetical protein
MTILTPEGAEELRGAKVVPAHWEISENVAQAQANFERLLDIAEAAEESPSKEGDAAPRRGPKIGR